MLLHFHYFISLETANIQKSERFLLRVSLGNVNTSGVVTWWYSQIYKKIPWEKLDFLSVCSYYAKFAFQSKSTLYSCLHVKELLARSRCHIWRLGDGNGTRTHNHLFRKRTLNHFAKLAYRLWVRIQLLSLSLFVFTVTGVLEKSVLLAAYFKLLL